MDGKVLKSTVCADSAALGDAGVNNNSLTVASDERESVRGGLREFDWQ